VLFRSASSHVASVHELCGFQLNIYERQLRCLSVFVIWVFKITITSNIHATAGTVFGSFAPATISHSMIASSPRVSGISVFHNCAAY